ncbi:MAG: hypothetical protein Q9170_007290 [Blastenia crenularia]
MASQSAAVLTPAVTRYSKRKRGEQPSPITSPTLPESKKAKTPPPGINVGAKTVPSKKKTAATLPPHLTRLAPVATATYPSPFADLQEYDIENTTASEAVKIAFDVHLVLGRPEVENWDGGMGYASWYRHIEGPIRTGDEGEMYTRPICAATCVGAYGQICWDDQISQEKRVKKGKANVLKGRRAMEVFREDGKFFLAWEGEVRVNGEVCGGEDVAIGPLPDFAIVEVGEVVVFWWRNEEAMGYITPEMAEERLNRELFEGDQEDLGEVGDEGGEVGVDEEEREMKRWRQTWQRIWTDRINLYGQDASNDPNRDRFYVIKGVSDLEADEVVWGIATVWQTLRDQERFFAFNDWNGYHIARGDMTDAKGFQMPVMAAIHGSSDLLIPLLLDGKFESPPNSANKKANEDPTTEKSTTPPTEQDKNEFKGHNGHILFAVARSREENKVNVVIMDSLPGTYALRRIRESIRRTVCAIGWKAHNNKGLACPPEYEPRMTEEVLKVPFQEYINTCGIYAILNAWVYMLGLPALKRHRRLYYPERGEANDDWRDFLVQARRVINLALAGYVDLRTIRAFLNYFGYCQLENPDESKTYSEEVRTARMNGDILSGILEDQRVLEMVGAPPADERKYQVQDVEYVKKQTGCSHSKAKDLLEMTEEDADMAVSLYKAETTD